MADAGDILTDMLADMVAEGGKKASEGTGGFVQRVRGMGIRPRMYIARGFGEAASMASAPAAAVVVDSLAGERYSALKDTVAQKYILPNLQWWDEKLANARSLDTPEAREERHQLAPPEQARKIADLLMDQFGVKFLGGFAGQFFTQDYFMRKFDAPIAKSNNVGAMLVDRGVQLGGMVLLNSVASNQAIAAQNGLTKILTNAGVDEEKAESFANFAVNFSLPNAMAYVVSSELLTDMAKKGRL